MNRTKKKLMSWMYKLEMMKIDLNKCNKKINKYYLIKEL